MQGPKLLLDSEDYWITEMGGWIAGKRAVCRGRNIFSEYSGKRWMELFLYGITGRDFKEHEVLLFEQIWVICSSYPDSRIWNNRVSTLAGSAKSTPSLGVAASIAVTDAKILGVSPVANSMEFLCRAKMLKDQGADLKEIVLQELKEKRVLAGYGRPIIQTDERIEPLVKISNQLNLGDGDYVKLSFEVEKILIENRYRTRMNIAALVAALAADRGINKKELECWLTLAFSAGSVFCFIDGMSPKEGNFFPLSCGRIAYQGKSYRKWEN